MSKNTLLILNLFLTLIVSTPLLAGPDGGRGINETKEREPLPPHKTIKEDTLEIAYDKLSQKMDLLRSEVHQFRSQYGLLETSALAGVVFIGALPTRTVQGATPSDWKREYLNEVVKPYILQKLEADGLYTTSISDLRCVPAPSKNDVAVCSATYRLAPFASD